ncbi:MAG TPA: molybdenum cofactor guanylyltransferase [Thermoanaerobaculia bacterium]|nr:molybdenum cofactor guanylyltransferase [Thermoanaerobaculia bacterium]
MNGYVLTGGRSRRMGQSKTALFLSRVVAAAQPVFDSVIAVQRFGGEACEIETIFEEPHEEEAPLFGVVRALQHARGRCVILAVDYPLLSSPFLAFLRARVEASAAPLVVPEWDGVPQMLCAGYDAALLPLLKRRIARGELDLRGLIAEAGAEMIRETELRARFGGEPLMNVNTPEEREQAEGLYGR